MLMQTLAKVASFIKTSWMVAFPLPALDKQTRAVVCWAEVSYGDDCYVVVSSGRRRPSAA